MHFVDDEVFRDLYYINFGRVVPQSRKKLHAMWKSLNAEYKAVLSYFTFSGTHSSNFYDFGNGQHDIYYLQKHLSPSNQLSSTTSSSTECKHEKSSEIVDAICEMHSSSKQVELSKCSLDLIQQQEAEKPKRNNVRR